MKKEIILLATSNKHSNLCIAGIDTSTGEWIRIISDDSTISYAVKFDDTIYEDGSIPEILDIVQIECTSHQPCYYQSENYINDSGFFWKKIGRASIKDVLKIHPLEDSNYIFYNNDNKVSNDFMLSLSSKVFKHSLMLIAPTNIIIHVQEWEKKRVKMSFTYNDVKYSYLAVKDFDYEKRYLALDRNNYPLKNGTLLVLSLGECYNNHHSKLIATIMENA